MLKSNDKDQEAFVKPFTDKLKSDDDKTLDHLGFVRYCIRRKSIHDNKKIECSNSFPFHQFVSIIDESENQTVEDWGNAIVKELNDSKKSI